MKLVSELMKLVSELMKILSELDDPSEDRGNEAHN